VLAPAHERTASMPIPSTATRRSGDRGELTAAVSTCIGRRRGAPAAPARPLLPCLRKPSTGRRDLPLRRCCASAAGGRLRLVLARRPRWLLALGCGFDLVVGCGVGVTVWPTEFCWAGYIRRARNSGRWWCGGVKSRSGGRLAAAAGLKMLFAYCDGSKV
jgi:hypothetical protein